MDGELWGDDSIQFPRLICEFRASGIPDACIEEVINNMDIDHEALEALFDRAHAAWEKAKGNL